LAEGVPASGVEVVRAPLLEGTPHGFLGRVGGVSQGLVAGLNVGLGSGDDPAHIAQNRRLAAAAVAPKARLVTVYQVHSALCATAAEPWPDDARPHADALVTDRPGLVLGILTADCAPVLFADHEAGVVGAAHAGWKGAIAGVTDATLEAMERLGAERSRIVATVGPCIAADSYEVDESFRDRFLHEGGANAAFFRPGTPGHWQFDLEAYVVDRLRAAGIGRASGLGLDTYAAPQRFFSFRRATHNGEPSYGRQISLIARP
jgi:YfiH family protein